MCKNYKVWWYKSIVILISLVLINCDNETNKPNCSHDWSNWNVIDYPTCTMNGLEERICKLCSNIDAQTIAALGHECDWEVTVSASFFSEGEKKGTCKRCGHEVIKNIIKNISWSSITGIDSTFGTSIIRSIIWGGISGQEKFVAVGGNGKIGYSYNGINWTSIPENNVDVLVLWDITWGGLVGQEKFIAVGSDGKMFYSSDGIMWHEIPRIFNNFGIEPNDRILGVTWGGTTSQEKFIAVGDNGEMTYSPDCVNWTPVHRGTGSGESTFNNSISGITWGGIFGQEKFVAINSYDGMAYSSDGIVWTSIPAGTGAGQSTFGTYNYIYDITWGGSIGYEKFIAVGQNGKMAYSFDGVNWTAIPAGTGIGRSSFNTNDLILGVSWGCFDGEDMFIAVGEKGKMAYSSDGISWIAISAGAESGHSTFESSTSIQNITYGGLPGDEIFIAVGPSGRMAYSVVNIVD